MSENTSRKVAKSQRNIKDSSRKVAKSQRNVKNSSRKVAKSQRNIKNSSRKVAESQRIRNNTFWVIFYNILVILIYPTIILVSFFNSKIRTGIKGRSETLKKISNWKDKISKNDEIILFNCSSLGEYEQAKSVIEKMKSNNPEVKIALSFFSPSGYENFKDNNLVDIFFYLPFDLYWKVVKFITVLKPKAIIDVSYDIWPNLTIYTKKLNIDHYLISARLKANTSKLKPFLKSFFRILFSYYKRIFTVSENDYNLFNSLLNSSENIVNTGDTRFDNIEKRYQKYKNAELLPSSWKNDKIFIFGSTHKECHEKIIPTIKYLQEKYANLHFIIAPHDPDEKTFILFSEFLELEKLSKIDENSKAKNIFVNTIGDLAKLYFSSDFAYVGGGFGNEGLHNVMEPAVCGIPIFIGPKNSNSLEAQELKKLGAIHEFSNSDELIERINALIIDENGYDKISKTARKYILDSLGASKKIIEYFKNDKII
ncbi:MAG: glycosyltransferase N-terminal domain-containing protein [Candidatus Marinimicrobia bacterium]|nr:glycosyltransferase N-terminal domain-containing protein [Candidatus Neomarinimicrobiota bacterium]